MTTKPKRSRKTSQPRALTFATAAEATRFMRLTVNTRTHEVYRRGKRFGIRVKPSYWN